MDVGKTFITFKIDNSIFGLKIYKLMSYEFPNL